MENVEDLFDAVGNMTSENLKFLKAAVSCEISCRKNSPNRILLRKAPDGYRGDKTCIDFLGKVEFDWDFFDHADVCMVKKNGAPVGRLEQCHGNNGRGKLAAESFDPLPGVEVEWVD